MWGLAGIGSGELTLRQEGRTQIDTDLAMRMGAVGVKSTMLDGSGPSRVGVHVKSDAMWVRTETDRAEGLESAEGDVTRLRLILEGERVFEAGDGATFTPTGQVGLRHDGGDAETEPGVELGAGLRYSAGALTIEGAVRALVAHEDSGYEEWGASGAIRVVPSPSGHGLSLSLAPSWGSMAGGAEALWSALLQTLRTDECSQTVSGSDSSHDCALARWFWSNVTVTVSAHGPRPKARSMSLTSPTMPPSERTPRPDPCATPASPRSP